MVAEKFLGYIFFLFLRPEATTVGQTAEGGALPKLTVLSPSLSLTSFCPHLPALSGLLTFFPSLLPEQMQFGKRRAAIKALAERVFASLGWL